MKSGKDQEVDTMRPEYDFDYSKAEWGKFATLIMREGSNVIVLEPDVAEVFKDSEAVNEALRSLLETSKVN